MSGMIQPFQPNSVAVLAATTTSQPIALGGSGDTVLVTNPTAVVGYVSFGTSSSVSTSAATGSPILPGKSRIFQVGSLINYASGMLASGTGNLTFEQGTGTAY